ncbi:hypothetical protein DYBT9275_02842 [Dyadobacter sp. CECT 9275]|uniref:Uncharacterized protein n=1 Tax=Dyadobacter helix TaxID=2822344 RepID=A0A916NLQ5_9BACT|nr:hypothetical protein DYBT9275_02842 [Dyadobacter sp. CECT 9275]
MLLIPVSGSKISSLWTNCQSFYYRIFVLNIYYPACIYRYDDLLPSAILLVLGSKTLLHEIMLLLGCERWLILKGSGRSEESAASHT